MIIRVSGLKEVRNGLAKFPKVKEKETELLLTELAKNLQERLKRKVPVLTGWLKRSIMRDKKGKIQEVIIHSIYAMAVEKGSSPRWIPIEYLEQHKETPEAPGQRVDNPEGFVKISGRAQPFIEPSLRSFRLQLPRMLNRYVNKLITKSMGGKKWNLKTSLIQFESWGTLVK